MHPDPLPLIDMPETAASLLDAAVERMRQLQQRLAAREREQSQAAEQATLNLARRIDESEAQRHEATRALAQLRAEGIRVFVDEHGTLRAGPRSKVINGTAARINKYKAWFIELLSEAKA